MKQIITKFETLKGKTLTEVSILINSASEDILIFKCTDGKIFKMFHSQDCCEQVYLQDVCGNLKDILNETVLQAEESSNNEPIQGFEAHQNDSFTWTFYRIATIKGQVVFRWLGSSNGYYSERVDFVEEVV